MTYLAVLLGLALAYCLGWWYSPGTPVPTSKLDAWCTGYSTGYQNGWRDGVEATIKAEKE